jgi:hypothetical protein
MVIHDLDEGCFPIKGKPLFEIWIDKDDLNVPSLE